MGFEDSYWCVTVEDRVSSEAHTRAVSLALDSALTWWLIAWGLGSPQMWLRWQASLGGCSAVIFILISTSSWRASPFSCFPWFLCCKWPGSEAGQTLRNWFFLYSAWEAVNLVGSSVFVCQADSINCVWWQKLVLSPQLFPDVSQRVTRAWVQDQSGYSTKASLSKAQGTAFTYIYLLLKAPICV